MCPSFKCASLTGKMLTSLEWTLCCNPDCEISIKHVTYHKLTDSDKSLSTAMDYYSSKSNIVGLIIINTTNSVRLPNDFINKGGDTLLIPVYIVSSEDGEEIERIFRTREKESIEISVVVEGNMDSESPSVEHAEQLHHGLPSLL